VETIIVTLRKEDGQELDLEVPREVCAADLVQELALTFGLSGNFQVFAEPPNRLIAPPRNPRPDRGVGRCTVDTDLGRTNARLPSARPSPAKRPNGWAGGRLAPARCRGASAALCSHFHSPLRRIYLGTN